MALQHSCKEGVDGVNATHTGVQGAANTSRGADTAQLAQPGASYGTSTAIPATGDCAASACIFKIYKCLSSPPTLFFFLNFPEFNVDLFLNQELTAEVVRKAALTGAGHDSLCD